MSSSPIMITIEHRGLKVVTKAIKVCYSTAGVVYKVALPSTLSSCNQCWLGKDQTGWTIILGNRIDRHLVSAIKAGILWCERRRQLKLNAHLAEKLLSA